MTNTEQDFTEGETQPQSCCDLDPKTRGVIAGAMKREGCSGRNLLVINTGQPLSSESRTPEERAAFERLYRASRKRMEAEHRHVPPAARTAPYVRHGSPRARNSRRRPHSAAQRSSSRSGDSGDGEGEPSPSDLAAPCYCEQCGAELLEPARLCGLCKTDDELARPRARVCAHPQCDVVLTGKSTQKTCDGPDGPHKRWLSRERRNLRDRPAHTSCEECGRRWLSDLNPKLHPCPACGGVVRLGRPPVPATVARCQVPRDPLAGVDELVFKCLYGNRGLDSAPSTETAAPAKPLSPSETLDDPENEPVAVVIDINRFRERHVRFVAAMASIPPSERLAAVAA